MTGRSWPDRLRLDLDFDAEAMVAEVDALAAGGPVEASPWIPHFVQQNYRGDWSALPLRGPAGETHPVRQIYSDPTCDRFEDTPYLEVCPRIRDALVRIEAPLQCVRLMRLGPRSEILEHTDHDLAAEEGMARLHVPLRTGPDVHFHLNGSIVPMNVGECWYLRLRDPHAVVNEGDAPRIHLVMDVVVNDWLREHFDSVIREL